MTLASIIGTSFISVVVFLAVYWTFKPPNSMDSADGEPPGVEGAAYLFASVFEF